MSGEKLEYVKQAAAFVVDRLEESDRCALVAYDDQVHLVSSSIKMTGANRNEMKRFIRDIRIGGTTNLSGGWLQGCHEVAEAAEETTINRSLLLTDGLANVGITDLEELAMHARELATRGVTTSTFGVGLGFNEHLLEAMSNQGRGNFYFIETPMQIPDIFLREFNELAAITASNVEIELEIPAQVNVELLGGWANEKKDGKFRIFAGNLYSGQTQEIYLKVLTPPAAEKSDLDFSARVMAKDENGKVIEDKATWAFNYADAESVQQEDRKQDVLERYASVEMADRSTEALKLERAGERDKAHRLMNNSIMANRRAIAKSRIKHLQQEIGVQTTKHSFRLGSTFFGLVLSQQIESHFPNHCKIFWSISYSYAAFIFFESDIQAPMKFILNLPVLAYKLYHLCCPNLETGYKISAL
jgi:Ca-activated chloride channel family protein